MFKNMFSKLFKNDTRNQGNELAASEQYNGQAQIYAIPTVSSNFNSNQKSNSSSNVHSSKLDYYAKYDDNNTKQIYIAPHCIRYSNSTLDDTIYRIDDESLNEIAAEILESENMPPKLQIVYYDNNYFAINNSNLQIYKQLQLSGLITHVQADLISVEAIPYALREFLLQNPVHLLNNYSNEITDDEYHETQGNLDDNMSSSRDTNQSRTSSGVNNESNFDNSSEINQIQDNDDSNNEYSPDIIYTQDIFDENHIYVDEIYEFGACENCVDSGEDDGEDNDENGYDICQSNYINENNRLKEEYPCSSSSIVNGVSGKKFNPNRKLDIHLKKKANSNDYNQIELNEIVKNALKKEEGEKCLYKNLDDKNKVLPELGALQLDLNQKKLNDQLLSPMQMLPQNKNEDELFNSKQFNSKSISVYADKKNAPEIENLLQ